MWCELIAPLRFETHFVHTIPWNDIPILFKYSSFDLNIFYCFNIYMYKQKGRATSSSNISYGPSQVFRNTLLKF